MADPHLGWHQRRRHLPHFDASGVFQVITYRLADSLPKAVVDRFKKQVDDPDGPRGQGRLRTLIEAYVDAGHGSCLLRDESAARVVLDSWFAQAGSWYELHAWVVMPNHVHVLIQQDERHALHAIIQRWKSQSGRLINRQFARNGALWMGDYWDRYIRNDEHYRRAVDYIHQNPVHAGLVGQMEDWPWSSAGRSAGP